MITASIYIERFDRTMYAQAEGHDQEQLHERLKADDPLWEREVTFSEMTRPENARVSHRGLAMWSKNGR